MNKFNSHDKFGWLEVAKKLCKSCLDSGVKVASFSQANNFLDGFFIKTNSFTIFCAPFVLSLFHNQDSHNYSGNMEVINTIHRHYDYYYFYKIIRKENS